MSSLYIYGASGHGLVVNDIAKLCGYDKILYIDDGENKYPSFTNLDIDFSIPIAFGVGDNKTRKKLFKKVEEKGFSIVSLIHPSASIAQDVTINKGTVIMANVVINVGSTIGEGVILNSSSTIEHENNINDFVHISPNVALAGNVTVECDTHIGIGSSVIQFITIGQQTIVGAGSVVIKDIPSCVIAYGNPCKVIRKLDE
jgi:UDP-N-acetylbacillosamine N-acetyltransferase